MQRTKETQYGVITATHVFNSIYLTLNGNTVEGLDTFPYVSEYPTIEKAMDSAIWQFEVELVYKSWKGDL